MLALLAGCASPGTPRPPSLKLPEIVSGSELTATRVGDQVRLHWTTPSRTTDKLLITGPIVAEICRETVGVTAAASADAAAKPRKNAAAECSAMKRVQVAPGASEAVDPLPAALTAGPPLLLAYRVQLLNAAGRTAGPSPAVYAVAGPSVRPVEGLSGKATKNGVVLEWKSAIGSTEAIELDRTVIESPAIESPAATATAKPTVTTSTAVADPARIRGLPGAQKEPVESRLRSSDADSDGTIASGTIDRSAQFGHTYRYAAQRVRSVVVAGQALQMLSVPSAEVTVVLRDEFPPDTPQGLVSVPSFAGDTDQTRKPAIDLSWEPNAEPRIAGYRVYRQTRGADGADANSWRLLDAELVAVAAYRDATVAAGQKYAYRVTAVNQKGGESQRSDAVVEAAPTQ